MWKRDRWGTITPSASMPSCIRSTGRRFVSGLRRANVRVEKRLDGSLAVRYGERYLPVTVCDVADRPKASPPVKAAKPRRTGQRGSDWGKNFDLKKGPKVWQVAAESGRRKGTTE